jgi:hypothetical protein
MANLSNVSKILKDKGIKATTVDDSDKIDAKKVNSNRTMYSGPDTTGQGSRNVVEGKVKTKQLSSNFVGPIQQGSGYTRSGDKKTSSNTTKVINPYWVGPIQKNSGYTRMNDSEENTLQQARNQWTKSLNEAKSQSFTDNWIQRQLSALVDAMKPVSGFNTTGNLTSSPSKINQWGGLDNSRTGLNTFDAPVIKKVQKTIIQDETTPIESDADKLKNALTTSVPSIASSTKIDDDFHMYDSLDTSEDDTEKNPLDSYVLEKDQPLINRGNLTTQQKVQYWLGGTGRAAQNSVYNYLKNAAYAMEGTSNRGGEYFGIDTVGTQVEDLNRVFRNISERAQTDISEGNISSQWAQTVDTATRMAIDTAISALTNVAVSGTGLAASAATEAVPKAIITTQRVPQAIIDALESPAFYTSLVQEYGSAFEEYTSNGVDRDKAQLIAGAIATLNAYVEVQGGTEQTIQKYVDRLINKVPMNVSTDIFREHLINALEEGLEEMIQAPIGNLGTKLAYDSDQQIFDPSEMFGNAASAFVSSLLLGGIETSIEVGVNKMRKAKQNRQQATALGEALLQDEDRTEFNEIIAEGVTSSNESIKARAYEIFEKYKKNASSVNARDVGNLAIDLAIEQETQRINAEKLKAEQDAKAQKNQNVKDKLNDLADNADDNPAKAANTAEEQDAEFNPYDAATAAEGDQPQQQEVNPVNNVAEDNVPVAENQGATQEQNTQAATNTTNKQRTAANTQSNANVQQNSSVNVNANSTYSTRQAATITEADIKSFGENGQKAVVTGLNEATKNNSNVSGYLNAFKAYYKWGSYGKDFDSIDTAFKSYITEAAAKKAYYSGVNDAAATLAAKMKQTTTASSSGGILPSTINSRVDESTRNYIDAIARALRVNVALVDEDDGWNGRYENGQIYLSINSTNPLTSVFSHELTHMLRERSPQEYDAYKNIVATYLNEQEEGWFEGRLQAMINGYSRRGTQISRDDAEEEIMADAAAKFLADQETADIITKQNRGVAQKILDGIREILKKVKGVFVKDTGASSILSRDLATFKKAEQVWAKALANSTGTVDEKAKGKESKKVSKKEKAEKKAFEKGRIHYQLEKYDDHQLENWKGSKRIVVYQNDQQFREFIEDALNNTTTGKIYFGKVSEDLASRIENETGLKTKGLKLSLSAYEIRKILLNSHGNESIEASRGQRAIIADDLLLIPDVISEPDEITKDAKLYNGAPVLKFQKNIDGRTVIVTYISTKHGDLAVQTMYGGIKNRSLATPSNAAANAAPYSVTSKTSRGTASTDSSIAQKSDKINNQNSEGKVKYQLREDFEEEFDAWDKKSRGGYFRVGTTSEALKSIGVKDSEISWDKSKILKIMNDHPEMTEDVIKQVPQLLENPIVVTQSLTRVNRIVAMGDVYDEKGNPIVAAVVLKPTNKNNYVMDFIKIASSYKRDNKAIKALFEDDWSNVLYLDPNKKRTNNWLVARRLQLPVGLTSYGSIHNVTYTEENSKGQIEYKSNKKFGSSFADALEKAREKGKTPYQLQEDNPYDWLADGDEDLEEISYDENGVAYPGDEDVPQQNESVELTEDMSADWLNEETDGVIMSSSELGTQIAAVRAEAATIGSATKATVKSSLNKVAEEYSFEKFDSKVESAVNTAIAYIRKKGSSGANSAIASIYQAVKEFIGDDEDISKKHEYVDDRAWQDTKGLRDYLKTYKLYISPKTKADITDYNDFRKKNIGNFRLTNDRTAMGIDTAYMELLEMYPGLLDSKITHPAEQLRELADVIEASRPVLEDKSGEYFGNADEAAISITADILHGVTAGISDAKVGKVQAEMRKAEDRYTQQVSDFEGAKKAYHQQLEEKYRQQITQLTLDNKTLRGDKEVLKEELKKAYDQLNKAKDQAYRDEMKVKIKDLKEIIELNANLMNQKSENRILKAKYEAKINELTKENAALRREMKRAYRREQNLAIDLEVAKTEAAKELFKQINRIKEYNRKQREKEKERRAVREARAKLERVVKRVSTKLLKPSDTQHIPQSMRLKVSSFLATLDMRKIDKDGNIKDTKVNAAWAALATACRDAAKEELNSEDEYIVIDPDLANRLDELAQSVKTAKMTSEQLQELYKAVKALEKMCTAIDKVRIDGQMKEATEVARGIISDLSSRAQEDTKTFKGIKQLNQFLKWDMMDPARFSDRMGKNFKKLYTDLRKGHDKKIEMWQEAKEYTYKSVLASGVAEDEKNVQKALRKLEETKVKVVLGGKDVELTKAQLMNLYLIDMRPQGQQHIYSGGIRLVESETTFTETRHNVELHVTKEEVEQAWKEGLEEKERDLAKRLQKFLANQSSSWGNKVSLELYGYKKFTEKNYWPISSDPNFTRSEIGKPNETKQNASIKNSGFTKALDDKASNPLMLDSAISVYAGHVTQMASYGAYVVPLETMNKVVNWNTRHNGNWRSVRKSLGMAYGDDAKRYFNNFLMEVNGEKLGDHQGSWINTLTGHAKGAAIGGNLRVVVQQPTSYARALDIIPVKYLAQALAQKKMTKGDEGTELMYLTVPEARWKNWGYGGDGFKGSNFEELLKGKSGLDAFEEKFSALAGKADDVTWKAMYRACVYWEKAETGNDATTEEGRIAIRKRFNEVIDYTQVYDSPFKNGQIFKTGNDLTDVFTAFMKEPVTNYNVMMGHLETLSNANDNLKAAKLKNDQTAVKAAKLEVKSARAGLVRGAIGIMLAGVLAGLVTAPIDAGRDKDDEKFKDKLIEAFFGDSIIDALNSDGNVFTKAWNAFQAAFDGGMWDNTNPIGWIPYISSIQSLLEGYDVEIMGIGAIQDVGTATTSLYKSITGQAMANTTGYYVYNLAKKVSTLAGIPIGNVLRAVESGLNLGLMGYESATGTSSSSIKFSAEKLYYSPKSSTGQAAYLNTMYEAMLEGNSDLAENIGNYLINKGDMTYDQVQNKIASLIASDEEFSDIIQRYADAYNSNDYEELVEIGKEANKLGLSTDHIQKAAKSLISDSLTTYAEAYADAVNQGASTESILQAAENDGLSRQDVIKKGEQELEDSEGEFDDDTLLEDAELTSNYLYQSLAKAKLNNDNSAAKKIESAIKEQLQEAGTDKADIDDKIENGTIAALKKMIANDMGYATVSALEDAGESLDTNNDAYKLLVKEYGYSQYKVYDVANALINGKTTEANKMITELKKTEWADKTDSQIQSSIKTYILKQMRSDMGYDDFDEFEAACATYDENSAGYRYLKQQDPDFTPYDTANLAAALLAGNTKAYNTMYNSILGTHTSSGNERTSEWIVKYTITNLQTSFNEIYKNGAGDASEYKKYVDAMKQLGQNWDTTLKRYKKSDAYKNLVG